MTIPRIPGLLVMLALSHNALALQMGQIVGQSVRGEPLMARVSVYGRPALASGDVDVELIPAFGASHDALAQYGLAVRLVDNEREGQAIIVTSTRPIDFDVLALRLRLREGNHAMIRHYELSIPAAPPAAVARASRATPATRAKRSSGARTPRALPATSVTMDGNYGPVRAGQSLWSILKETGLTSGDSAALMRDIVAANPAAFVNGDASRLRVGANLRLPQVRATAKAASASASASASVAAPVAKRQSVDAETAARLARLTKKFEEIRTRYAAQQLQAGTAVTKAAAAEPIASTAPAPIDNTKSADSAAPAVADTVPVKQAAAAAVAKPSAAPARAKAPTRPMTPAEPAPPANPLDALAKIIDGRVLMGIGALLLVVSLVLGGLRVGRRMRMRLADAGVRSADRDLVAEIARKTEKRVQLEDEVRRMIAGRNEAGEDSARGALRPADLLAGVRGTLEEIETRIAHGQYNEAEAMLEQAIVDAPNNFRAKLRLAEIYYLNERHEEFVDLAEEIHRQHRSDIGDENWARLMRMGKVIAPDRPPFSGPVAVEAARRAR